MRKYVLILLVSLTNLALSRQASVEIFEVHHLGATGDGKTSDQAAIQKGIDTCRDQGGTVLLKTGRFFTGQLTLTSNMTLFVDSTAIILGIQSDDARCPTMTHHFKWEGGN